MIINRTLSFLVFSKTGIDENLNHLQEFSNQSMSRPEIAHKYLQKFSVK